MDKIIEKYYCSNCFKDFEIDLTEVCKAANNIPEFKNSKYPFLKIIPGCPYCGKDATFMVDEDMIDLIRLANEKGYETFAHCSGHLVRSFFHYNSSQAYIAMYASKDQIEQIKNIPCDDIIKVEYGVRIIDPGMTDPNDWCWDTITLRYNITTEDYSDLKYGIQLMGEFISKFPQSNEFYKNAYADIETCTDIGEV